MSNVTKITYAIALDTTTEIIKQMWLNKIIDINAKLKPLNWGNPDDDYIDMIRKIQPELADFKIRIVGTKSISHSDFEKEIGADYI